MNYTIKPRKENFSLTSILGGVTLATILSACVTTSKVEEPILPTPATIEETTYSEKTTNNTTIPQDPLLERTWTFEGEENTREQYWEVALDQGGIAEKGKNWINDNGDILHSTCAIDDDLDGRADTIIESSICQQTEREEMHTCEQKKRRNDRNFDGIFDIETIHTINREEYAHSGINAGRGKLDDTTQVIYERQNNTIIKTIEERINMHNYSFAGHSFSKQIEIIAEDNNNNGKPDRKRTIRRSLNNKNREETVGDFYTFHETREQGERHTELIAVLEEKNEKHATRTIRARYDDTTEDANVIIQWDRYLSIENDLSLEDDAYIDDITISMITYGQGIKRTKIRKKVPLTMTEGFEGLGAMNFFVHNPLTGW